MTDWMSPQNSNVNVTVSGSPSQQQAAAVKDISTADFAKDVIEASADTPVLVDFWAPWCGPCKQLTPILEQAVAATNGKVRLVKMDIDQHPEIAGQMGIQSIPAVVAFVGGRPADAFMGAKPAGEVRAFIEKLAASAPNAGDSEIEAAMAEAVRLQDEKDFAGAAQIYASVLAHEPGNLDAITGMGQCYLAVGETEQARALVDQVPEEHHQKPPLAILVTALQLAEQADDLGDIAPLKDAVDANPDDHQARFDYAVALNAAGKRDEAGQELLTIIRKDREWNEDGARTKLLEFFEAWGPMDKATISARRALSSLLFS